MAQTPEIAEINRVLAFANSTRIENAEAAYKHFEPTAEQALALLVEGKRMVIEDKRIDSWIEVGGVRCESWDGERLTPERELELLEQWRKSAHAMLSQIVRRRMKQARREFGERFTHELVRGAILGQARFDGRVLVQNSLFVGPVIAHVAFVLALLLDAEHPFGKMLRRCQWPKCKHFYLHASRGTPPMYCPACREPDSDQARQSAAKRQKKYRESLMESSR